MERNDALEEYFGNKSCRTTTYHLICNGMVERLNSTVVQMLHALSEKVKYEWKDLLNSKEK